MIFAVFSDVHGNLPALETFLKRTKGAVDAYLCLGDTVDYGPWNDECLEMISSLPGIRFVEGNHERLFLGTESIAAEIPIVREFYESSRKFFTRTDLIQDLPLCLELTNFLCTHTIDGKKVYKDTTIDIDRDYLIGHTHQQYSIERGGKRIVNPGSVGQNRGSIETINYAHYDTATDEFTFFEVPYKIDVVINELMARGYSERCINYYRNKRSRPGEIRTLQQT